jgi:hypothetical protein
LAFLRLLLLAAFGLKPTPGIAELLLLVGALWTQFRANICQFCKAVFPVLLTKLVVLPLKLSYLRLMATASG